MTVISLFKKQFYKVWLSYLREPRPIVQASLFFLMICIFFPLTLPVDPSLIRIIAPGLVWTAVLLSLLLSSLYLFQQDYEEGILEQWVLSGYSLPLIVSAKIMVHWIFNLIPVLIFCPLFGILFNLSIWETISLMFSLILGTPAMVLLCGLAAAFSTGLQQKGILMALILLPLTLPIMIFGSGCLSAVMQGFASSAYLAILLAMSLLVVGFLPFAIAAVIQISLAE